MCKIVDEKRQKISLLGFSFCFLFHTFVQRIFDFIMSSFVHLHTHTQYSLLDGQASVKKLVDKAIEDGMPGIAITDHGNMFAIKEFMNYVNKVNGAKADREKGWKKLLDKMLKLEGEHSDLKALLASQRRPSKPRLQPQRNETKTSSRARSRPSI